MYCVVGSSNNDQLRIWDFVCDKSRVVWRADPVEFTNNDQSLGFDLMQPFSVVKVLLRLGVEVILW